MSKTGRMPLRKKAAFVTRKIWHDRVSYAFLFPFAVVFLLFTVLPVLISIFYSFTYNNILEPPRFVWLENYVRLFTRDQVFLTGVQNTLVFALITGPGGYILSFAVAWADQRIVSVAAHPVCADFLFAVHRRVHIRGLQHFVFRRHVRLY